jgi:hypothetical protein
MAVSHRVNLPHQSALRLPRPRRFSLSSPPIPKGPYVHSIPGHSNRAFALLGVMEVPISALTKILERECATVL